MSSIYMTRLMLTHKKLLRKKLVGRATTRLNPTTVSLQTLLTILKMFPKNHSFCMSTVYYLKDCFTDVHVSILLSVKF